MIDDEPELLAALALEADPVAPSPDVKKRLMASVKKADRFAQFVDTIASLCDIAADAAQSLVDGIDDAARWIMGPADGVELFHIDAGPRLANAIVGFTRIEPGKSFPVHTHVGDEIVLVLQGAYADPDGAEHRRGARIDMKAGTTHTFTALPGPALIYLVVVDQGITFDDPNDVVGPGDPRA